MKEKFRCTPIKVYKGHPFSVCRSEVLHGFMYMVFDPDRKILLGSANAFNTIEEAEKEVKEHIEDLIKAKKKGLI